MNYTELSQAIQDYTSNYETTFVSQIPTFIAQAEERIFNSVVIPEIKKNVTGTTTSGDQYLARPTDFINTLSLAVIDASGDYSYLLRKDVSFIREAYPSAATTGQPKFYAVFDGDAYSGGAETSSGNFILGPTPDDDYSVELHYNYEPPSIVDTGVSWLGENAEALLLYGCLIEAYTFMKGEPDMLQLYSERYQEALSQQDGVDLRMKKDNYRDGEKAI